MTEWVRVASVTDVPEGEGKAIEVGGKSIAVFHLDGGAWHATDNICTHAYALLTDGWLEGTEIECPLHAGRFDVRTGKGLCAPIEKDLDVFPIKVEGTDVLVQV